MTHDDANDDIMDERIRALAAEQYNAPDGDVPREAMWEQIAAARRAARTARIDAERSTSDAIVVPIASRRAAPRTIVVWRWSAALAAGLLLAFVLGRELGRRDGATSALPPVARAGRTDSGAQSVGSSTAGARSGAESPSGVVAAAPVAPEHTSRDASAPLHPTERASIGSRSLATRDAEARDSTTQTLYRAAAVQTLVQAEAVLTAYRGAEADSRDPQAVQQASRWARDVLSSTRLLMDSPAGRDPRMRTLFTDLELVLAQIVQLSGTPLDASERELIDRAMRDRDLLPRLRSAVPAGLATS